MARTKHRKAHTAALAHRRTMQALAEASRPPAPVKVKKNRFQVQGTERPTTPEEIAALPEIQITGSGMTYAPGDVIHVTDGAGKPYYARVAKPLRGMSSNFLALDDEAHFPKAFVDGQEVPSQLTATGRVILDEAPPKGSQVLINVEADYKRIEERMAAQLGLPLEVLHGRRAGMSQAHVEMGWHPGLNGEPVFDEISICPGPDPNGITDLK